MCARHDRFEHIPRASGRAQLTMDGSSRSPTSYQGGRSLRRRFLDHSVVVCHGTLRANCQSTRDVRAAETSWHRFRLALGCSFSGYPCGDWQRARAISLKAEAIGCASMPRSAGICNSSARGCAQCTGVLDHVEQSDLHQAISAVTATAARRFSRRKRGNCFYYCDRSRTVARKDSTPVSFLRDHRWPRASMRSTNRTCRSSCSIRSPT